jgi:hypothetical protein
MVPITMLSSGRNIRWMKTKKPKVVSTFTLPLMSM